MKELCQRLGIRRTRSSPFNPQGNGQAERTNRTLAERLAMDLEAMDQTDWDEKLSSALSAIRTVPNCTTGESPHFLVFGRAVERQSGPLGNILVRGPYV